MIDRIFSLSPLLWWAINSTLLAKYYSSSLVPKNNNSKFVFIAFGAAYFGVQFLVHILIGDYFGLLNPIGDFVRTIVLIILVFAISLVLFKSNVRLSVFMLFSFFAVQDITDFIMLSVNKILGNAYYRIFSSLLMDDFFTTHEQFLAVMNGSALFMLILKLIIYTMIAAFALRTITKKFTYKNYVFSTSELSYLLLPCLSSLAITHIIRALLIRLYDYGYFLVFFEVPFIDHSVPLVGFVFLFSVIAAVKSFQKLGELRNEEIERSVLQKQVQQLQQQINDVDGIYTEIRGFRHDVKNHISNILVLANAIVEGNTDVKNELEEYLKKFGETLNKFEFTYKTGNPISDIIIHQKYHESLKSGIEFTADFNYPMHLNLDAYDLAIIINNALENAIEACVKMKNSKRFIRLYAYTKGEMFFIDVENNFESAITLDKNTGLPRSSKSDKTVHGMGLSNIQRCARKYFGDIDFQVSQVKNFYVFRLTVMLQGRD